MKYIIILFKIKEKVVNYVSNLLCSILKKEFIKRKMKLSFVQKKIHLRGIIPSVVISIFLSFSYHLYIEIKGFLYYKKKVNYLVFLFLIINKTK